MREYIQPPIPRQLHTHPHQRLPPLLPSSTPLHPTENNSVEQPSQLLEKKIKEAGSTVLNQASHTNLSTHLHSQPRRSPPTSLTQLSPPISSVGAPSPSPSPQTQVLTLSGVYSQYVELAASPLRMVSPFTYIPSACRWLIAA